MSLFGVWYSIRCFKKCFRFVTESSSVVVSVHLTGQVVHSRVSFDVGGRSTLFHHNRRTVQVDAVVHNQQWVVVVDHVVVYTHAVQVLLEQVLEEQVLFLKGGLLLLDGELVEVDLVVTLVEVVELLELVVAARVDTDDLFDHLLGLFLGIRIGLVEREDLFFLGLKLTTELCCLQDTLTESLVRLESLHALETIGDKSAQVFSLLLSQFSHLVFQVSIMRTNRILLFQ